LVKLELFYDFGNTMKFVQPQCLDLLVELLSFLPVNQNGLFFEKLSRVKFICL